MSESVQIQAAEPYLQASPSSPGQPEHAAHIPGMWTAIDPYLKAGSSVWLLKRACLVDELFKPQQHPIYANPIIYLRAGWLGTACSCDTYYYYLFLAEKLANAVESRV